MPEVTAEVMELADGVFPRLGEERFFIEDPT
jgi:hypothetical protein